MRMFGTPPDPKRHYTIRPGAYAVIRRGAQLLVTEQTATNIEIQLPGGGIDPGEGPLNALHRECLEETGWTIQIKSRLGVYQRYVFMPEYDLWARKICHIFLCDAGIQRSLPSEAGHRAILMPWQDAVGQFASNGDSFYAAEAMSAATS